jgi:cation:H+ antiporter
MIEYILFVLGIILLLKGADYLVEGSSSLAKKFGISTLVIGLTIVAFGTSMPELIVNILAALRGSGSIAFGNIVGSNIANILLILGVTAIIVPLTVQKSTVWKEVPFSLLATIILVIFASTFITDNLVSNTLYRFEGIILLLFFSIFLYYVFELTKKHKKTEDKLEIPNLNTWKITLFIVGGLIALYFGGKWTVEGAIAIAKLFGMSEYFISLTVLAIGTSLPELITSIVAALKGDADLAVGNAIGSNIFNIFWVLGISAIITPLAIPTFAITDLLILIGVNAILLTFMLIGKKHKIERWQGILFVLAYMGYITYLIIR